MYDVMIPKTITGLSAHAGSTGLINCGRTTADVGQFTSEISIISDKTSRRVILHSCGGVTSA